MEIYISILALIISLVSIGVSINLSVEKKYLKKEVDVIKNENINMKSDIKNYNTSISEISKKIETKQIIQNTTQDNTKLITSMMDKFIDNPEKMMALIEMSKKIKK